MAKFFVGQRVKIVSVDGCTENNYLLGLEGIVNEINCSWYSVNGEVDGGVVLTIGSEHDWAFGEWQLEPSLPEGAQPLGYSFEQMMSEFGIEEAVK